MRQCEAQCKKLIENEAKEVYRMKKGNKLEQQLAQEVWAQYGTDNGLTDERWAYHALQVLCRMNGADYAKARNMLDSMTHH
jgi:hypothetical protein